MKNQLVILASHFTLIGCLFAGNSVFAQSVNINVAKEIAIKKLKTIRGENLKMADLNPENYHLTIYSGESKNDTLYYVVTDSVKKGFVIIAADLRSWPILGYSSDGKFDSDNLPPAFVSWMENRKREISAIKANNILPKEAINQEWGNLLSLNSNLNIDTTSVSPLLKTAWNQDCYYNAKCPAEPKGQCGHALTGCNATAMAQILKYWSYPNTGVGTYSYKHSVYGNLIADFGTTTYQWSQMQNNLSSNNDAVAVLLYHCGVALNMDYGPYGSGSIPSSDALVSRFNYSSSARQVRKSDYSSTDWENLLKFELNSHRPIWYLGQGWSGGHAFVFDGYRSVSDFHINWGWGGYSDGYYYLGDLNPSGYSYNDSQEAIINIFPNSIPGTVGSISGKTLVCQGQSSVNYTVSALNNAVSYIWTLPNGAIGISTTNSINLNFSSNAQSGIIKVKARNTSGDGPESTLPIIVNQNTNTTLTITVVPAFLPSSLE